MGLLPLEVALLVLLTGSQGMSATCMEREEHIQRYLISSQPPYDNYYNISKAVYPSVDLPSLLIKITITFLHGSDNLTHLARPSRSSTNGSTSNISQTGENIREPTETKITTYQFTWSASCLYVSGGSISLASMNVFSLWAIYPNRRERHLHLTLPQFCRGFSADTMIYFLSTLQDIAISPSIPNPRLNTVECVTMGHGKAPPFPGWKNLLHGVCWCILCISLVFSQVASQWLVVQLREWKTNMNSSGDEAEKKKYGSRVAAIMFFSIVVFVTGLSLIFFAWSRSSFKQDYYMWAFFISAMVVLARRVVHCFCSIKESNDIVLHKHSLTKGHESDPSGNAISFFTLYPAIFMACHHLLWILLGVITEPFWGISVLVAVISVSAIVVFFFYDFYEYCLSHECNDPHCELCSARRDCESEYWFPFFMSLFLVLGSCVAFVLLIIVLLVVAQSFLSESLVSTLVQNGLVSFATLWLGYLKLNKPGNLKLKLVKKPAETGNGGSQSSQTNVYELMIQKDSSEIF